jgi:acetyltransferase-like isoleucine patch superfamily enzyme
MIDACGLVEIGHDNMFGPDVYIKDANRRFGVGLHPRRHPMAIGTLKSGNRCWVGANAAIRRDVELGGESVVGAGAVVTMNVPLGTVVVGMPAKIIRHSGATTECLLQAKARS